MDVRRDPWVCLAGTIATHVGCLSPLSLGHSVEGNTGIFDRRVDKYAFYKDEAEVVFSCSITYALCFSSFITRSFFSSSSFCTHVRE